MDTGIGRSLATDYLLIADQTLIVGRDITGAIAYT